MTLYDIHFLFQLDYSPFGAVNYRERGDFTLHETFFRELGL